MRGPGRQHRTGGGARAAGWLCRGVRTGRTMAAMLLLARGCSRTPTLRHVGSTRWCYRSFSAAPTMAMIKELREQTGAPIVDVKKALVESDCDLSEARLWLRDKGLAKAQKKAGRLTAEGLVAVASDAGESGLATRVSAEPRDRHPRPLLATEPASLRAQIAMVELACETDFVARNSQFQQAADELAQSLLVSSPDFTSGSTANELAEQLAASEGVAEQIGLLSATVGENVTIRRAGRLVLPEGSEGVVSCYLHGALSPSTGQIASAVVLCAEPGSTDSTSIALMGEYGKRLAMQVVAARPLYATRDDVPDDMLAAEKATILKEVRHSLSHNQPDGRVLSGENACARAVSAE